MDVDLGAHPPQFGDVHIAIFENRFFEEALAVSDAQHRHELGLHVGRETGIGRGRDRQRLQRLVGRNPHPGFGEFDHQPGRGETIGDRQHVGRARPDQLDRAAGDAGRTGVAAGLDPVGHHVIVAAVQPLDPVDHQVRRADPLDPGPHRRQQPAQVDDFGFARGVEQLAAAGRQHRRHQRIFGGADRHHREAVIAAGQPSFRRGRLDVAGGQFDLGADRLECL